MNSIPEKNREIKLVTQTPSVALILPFEPKMARFTDLEESIHKATSKATAEIKAIYQKTDTNSIIRKLNNTVKNLNYNTHKKSIAILVSDNTEKIFYLDFPVTSYISVDGQFQLKDIILFKKENQECLILSLYDNNTDLYFCNTQGIVKLILHDSASHKEDLVTDSDPIKLKKYENIDKSLSLLRKGYSLPVFVMGNEKVISEFKNISKNKEHIVKYIPEKLKDCNSSIIQDLIRPYLKDWHTVRQSILQKQIDQAIKENKLIMGLYNVWDYASRKNVKTLIIENNIFTNSRHIHVPINMYQNNPERITPFYIKDPVDDIIEKTLNNGGEIEFCEQGLLTNLGHIALIAQF